MSSTWFPAACCQAQGKQVEPEATPADDAVPILDEPLDKSVDKPTSPLASCGSGKKAKKQKSGFSSKPSASSLGSKTGASAAVAADEAAGAAVSTAVGRAPTAGADAAAGAGLAEGSCESSDASSDGDDDEAGDANQGEIDGNVKYLRGAPPPLPPTPAPEVEETFPEATAAALRKVKEPGAKLQVMLGGMWADLGAEETANITAQLMGGQKVFAVSARGQMYLVDFIDPERPTQRNHATNKLRRLRVKGPNDVDSRRPGRFHTADSAVSLAESAAFSRQASRASANSGQMTPHSAYASVPGISEMDDDAGDVADDDDYEELIWQQQEYGPQSRRGNAPQEQLSVLATHEHAQKCFERCYEKEKKYCGEWAVFYHAYSLAALLYEVHAAIAASLFRFRSDYATLPRILVHEFTRFPDAASLVSQFEASYKHGAMDHEEQYRKVAISAMCSLVALGPEASTPISFLAGYSEKDLSFRGVLENLLESCYVPKKRIKALAKEIVALSEKHGLDVSQFGGQPCESRQTGHLLQIFIRRDLVDMLAYAAKPYGAVDKARHPISEWLNGDNNTNCGQARLVVHPLWFMQSSCVRMFVASADPKFHWSRKDFQVELTNLLGGILEERTLRERVAKGIFGGELPDWFEWDPGTGKGSKHAEAGTPTSANSASAGSGRPASQGSFWAGKWSVRGAR